MREMIGNIFEIDADAVCVTTNGFVKRNGEGVMGAGIAKQMKDMFPDLPKLLGNSIKKFGNEVNVLCRVDGTHLVAFPTKDSSGIADGTNVVPHASYMLGAFVPGFHLKSTLQRIEQSCKELVWLTDFHNYKTVLLTRAGCGNGGLDWNDVKPVMAKLLDDRFIIVDIKG